MVEKNQDVRIVKWFMADKGLIKFNGDESQYFLADNVKKISDFVKYPLNKGDSVNVTIVENKVTYIRKVKSDAPKAPAPEQAVPTDIPQPTPIKEEVKPEVVNEQWEILTLQAVATDKKVVKFIERPEDKWFKIVEDIQKLDYKEIGLVANGKVSVVLNGKTVVKVAKIAPQTTQEAPSQAKTEPAKTTTSVDVKGGVRPDNDEVYREKITTSPPKKEWKPYNNDSDARQISIEAQASINSACQVVGMVAPSVTPTPSSEVLNKMIRIIAESNYALIQELKRK